MPAQPVTCPDCRATLQIDDQLFGKPVACGSCRKTFVPIRPNVPVAARKVRVPTPPAAPPPAPPPTQPVPVPTEYSRETAPRSNYGSRKTKPVYDDEEDEVEERAEKSQRKKPKRSSSKKSENNGKMIAIGVGGLFAVALIIVGMVSLFSKSTKAEVASTSPTPIPAVGGQELAAGLGNKELTAETLRKVKAATVRVDVKVGRDEGSGSGFLIHSEGLIVTNAHVVGYSRREGNRPATSIQVVFASGEPNQRVLQASVFGVDGDADIALIRVPKEGLPAPLSLGSSKDLRETQELFVFGFPLGDMIGKEISVTTTTISSLRREKESGPLTAIQVNGGMHPGNSGGPLTDRGGQVVGIAVSAIKDTSINFAIPSDLINEFVHNQIAAPSIKPATVAKAPPQTTQPPFVPPSMGGRGGLPRGPFGPIGPRFGPPRGFPFD